VRTNRLRWNFDDLQKCKTKLRHKSIYYIFNSSLRSYIFPARLSVQVSAIFCDLGFFGSIDLGFFVDFIFSSKNLDVSSLHTAQHYVDHVVTADPKPLEVD
jgi:hypothetical protein